MRVGKAVRESVPIVFASCFCMPCGWRSEIKKALTSVHSNRYLFAMALVIMQQCLLSMCMRRLCGCVCLCMHVCLYEYIYIYGIHASKWQNDFCVWSMLTPWSFFFSLGMDLSLQIILMTASTSILASYSGTCLWAICYDKYRRGGNYVVREWRFSILKYILFFSFTSLPVPIFVSD